MDDIKVHKKVGAASFVFLPDFEKDKEFHKNDDLHECENKMCSNETHALIFRFAESIFSILIHHANNHIK